MRNGGKVKSRSKMTRRDRIKGKFLRSYRKDPATRRKRQKRARKNMRRKLAEQRSRELYLCKSDTTIVEVIIAVLFFTAVILWWKYL